LELRAQRGARWALFTRHNLPAWKGWYLFGKPQSDAAVDKLDGAHYQHLQPSQAFAIQHFQATLCKGGEYCWEGRGLFDHFPHPTLSANIHALTGRFFLGPSPKLLRLERIK
jgi:hypothetical protein